MHLHQGLGDEGQPLDGRGPEQGDALDGFAVVHGQDVSRRRLREVGRYDVLEPPREQVALELDQHVQLFAIPLQDTGRWRSLLAVEEQGQGILDVAHAFGGIWEQADVPGQAAHLGDPLALLEIGDEQHMRQQVVSKTRGGCVALHGPVLHRIAVNGNLRRAAASTIGPKRSWPTTFVTGRSSMG